MKNTTKRVFLILLTLTIVISACVLVACNRHTHTYSDDWVSDGTGHWHEADCEHASETSKKQYHTFVDGVCSVCGYNDKGIDPEIYAIYLLYANSARASGLEPMTYEEWYADLLANAKGDKGDPGQNGVGVKSVEVTYQVAESGTVVPTGAWLKYIPEVPSGKYLWTRTVVTYTNNTTSTAYSVSRNGVDADNCEHVFGAYQVGVAATCESIGYDIRECTLCGIEDYRFVEATGHSFGKWADLVSNCTEHWQVSICSICGEVQLQSVEARGHRFSNGVCISCGAVDKNNTGNTFLDEYNGAYGYEFLGTMENGEARQTLYAQIKAAVTAFHVDGSNSDGLELAKLNFAQLGLTQNEAVAIWKTFKDDSPLYYWLSNSVQVEGDNLVLLVEEEYASGNVREFYNKLVYQSVDEFLSALDAGDAAYRVALGLHDKIIDTIDYAYDGRIPSNENWAHDIIGVFAEKGGVCEAYARTFQLLLNCAGVENLFVTGVANGNDHAWNLVKLEDGNWYWFDLTWDDTPGWKWGISYSYFCCTDEPTSGNIDFLATHTLHTSANEGISFLYDLPARSSAEFSTNNYPMIGDTFSVDNFDLTVVGYNAVELTAITDGKGHVKIPTFVEKDNYFYDVISLGGGERDYIIRTERITEVTIPNTVRFIWEFAFKVSSLKNIFVVADNPWFADKDGVLFTKSLYTLIQYPNANPRTEYVIPEETVIIADGAFGDKSVFHKCKYLSTLTIGRNVDIVGFMNWGSGYMDSPIKGGSININASAFTIMANSLVGAKRIIVDPANEYYYSDGSAAYTVYGELLYVNGDITSYEMPDSVKSISSDAFGNCAQLESLVIGVNVVEIDDWALFGFGNLKSITVKHGNPYYHSDGNCLIETATNTLLLGCKNSVIPDDGSVTSIASYAFYDCYDLRSIVIPSSIESIGNSAFANCDGLLEVYNYSKLHIVARSSEHGGVASHALIVHTVSGNSILTSTADGYVFYTDESGNWLVGYDGEDVDLILPTNFNGKAYAIRQHAFCHNTRISSVLVSEGVTAIDYYAFAYCTNLRNITISKSVTKLSASSFLGCSNLESIVVEDGNPVYHSDGNCLIETARKRIIHGSNKSVIPSDGSVNSIDQLAFADLTGLTQIVIPDCIVSIGVHAFDGCVNLERVDISKDSKLLTFTGFSSCSSLVSIYIPKTVTNIYDYAFRSCTKLEVIYFGGTVEQWNAITKGNEWRANVPSIKVICADGEVALESTLY